MKIFVVVGTRPEAIKMAPVFKALRDHGGFEPLLVSTGQHKEMLYQALDWFDLSPDIDLKLMSQNQTLSGLMAKAVTGLDDLIVKEQPDVILGQGDTTTVLASALAAFHRRVRFGHVEAGLRTHDLTAPFPEEGNRALAGRVATWHFAPTSRAVRALKAEAVPGDIHLVGNTVVDALLETDKKTSVRPAEFTRERMVLITGHRRENHGDRFRAAFGGLADLAKAHPECDFIYPVHLNPIVSDMAHEILSGTDNFKLIKPVAYPDIVNLMKHADLVLTDSGGIQEEAPTFGVPVLVMRDTTERQEAVEAGVCELVGTDPDRIKARATDLLSKPKPAHAPANPFGDGSAAQRIVKILAGEPWEPFTV